MGRTFMSEINRKFLVFTCCILSRQTLKCISALILFVAQLLLQCWLCKIQKAVSLPLECSCEVGLHFVFLLSQHLSPKDAKE